MSSSGLYLCVIYVIFNGYMFQVLTLKDIYFVLAIFIQLTDVVKTKRRFNPCNESISWSESLQVFNFKWIKDESIHPG